MQQKSFRAQAAQRIREHWLLKGLGTSIGITVFMTVYFILLRHPEFPVTLVPITGLDRMIGFEPWSLVPYVSLWFYISLVPMFLRMRELPRYLYSVALLALVGFALFFFWPTAVPPPDVDWSRYPYVAFLKAVDATGNACPSLHVAYGVLTALWLGRLLQAMGAPRVLALFNWLWCLTIAYSTLATKQHLALDVFTGAALGTALTAPLLRGWRPQARE
jgi:membrane-associated phospholipid phosphatase